ENIGSDWWLPEANCARDLFDHEYYPNTIIKLHKIIEKNTAIEDCGRIHFYLGKSYEALAKTGQAIDAFQETINRTKETDCQNAEAIKRVDEARKAIERLKL
ncbi:MAG: hypothetical protein GY839_09855, partial [candidate division Zixibacteria bacterium]|nr:hypothetical protein [candidate division Zixibacteria bacterium]